MIGVLVSGEGTNLQALIDAGLPIVAVASNRKDAPALDRARAAKIPSATFALDCHATREERDLVMARWLEEHGVELVVLAGYMHLLTAPFLTRFPDRIVNVHPSLLPKFPGAHAIDDALAAGVDATGVTVHLVDERLDSGPVIVQEAVPLEPRETLVQRLHAVEHRLLPQVVRELSGTRSVDMSTSSEISNSSDESSDSDRRGHVHGPGPGETDMSTSSEISDSSDESSDSALRGHVHGPGPGETDMSTSSEISNSSDRSSDSDRRGHVHGPGPGETDMSTSSELSNSSDESSDSDRRGHVHGPGPGESDESSDSALRGHVHGPGPGETCAR